MGTNLLVTAIVIVYLLFMLWIGWYSSTKITSNTDFMVAGRRLGPFLMAGTLADRRRQFSRRCPEWYVRLWSERILVYYNHGYCIHHLKLCCSEIPCGNC